MMLVAVAAMAVGFAPAPLPQPRTPEQRHETGLRLVAEALRLSKDAEVTFVVPAGVPFALPPLGRSEIGMKLDAGTAGFTLRGPGETVTGRKAGDARVTFRFVHGPDAKKPFTVTANFKFT